MPDTHSDALAWPLQLGIRTATLLLGPLSLGYRLPHLDVARRVGLNLWRGPSHLVIRYEVICSNLSTNFIKLKKLQKQVLLMEEQLSMFDGMLTALRTDDLPCLVARRMKGDGG